MARTLIIKSNDTNGNEYEKTFTSANPNATAANIDQFARSVVGITKGTYNDTIIRDDKSCNEILAEEEG